METDIVACRVKKNKNMPPKFLQKKKSLRTQSNFQSGEAIEAAVLMAKMQ
jgi:hypothetical protein